MVFNETTSRLLRIHPYKKVTLLLHTIVTYTYIGCCIYTVYLFWISDNVYLQHKFIINGKANATYLLSVWATVAEMIFFCSYSAIDVLEMYYLFYKKSETVLTLKQFLSIIVHYILFSVVFPMSVVVAVLFWGFYLWDRETIYPKIIDEIFPSFINHIMHTYPVPLSIIYMYVDIKMQPPKMEALVILTVFLITYGSIFFYANYKQDEWIYPALDALTPSQATLIVVLTMTTPYIVLFIGYFTYSKITDVRSYVEARVKKLKI